MIDNLDNVAASLSRRNAVARLRDIASAKSATVKAFLISGINQVFGSATNLLLGIYLVRHMSPAGFGLYNVAFAITISVGAIANGVFLVPMTVDMPHDDPHRRDRFMLEVIVGVAVAMALLSAAAIVLATGAIIFRMADADAVIMIAAVAASCTSYQLKDCMVQAAYNRGGERIAVWINIVAATSVAAMLLGLSMTTNTLTASAAVGIYALAQACAMLAGYFFLFAGVQTSSGSVMPKLWAQLRRGAWSAAASALSIFRTQAHTIIVTALLGPVGLARINAARLVFAPIQTVQPALVRAAMPRLMRTLHRDIYSFRRRAAMLTIGLGVISALFGLFVVVTGPYVYTFVVGKSYIYSMPLFAAWGLVFTLVALRGGLELQLQAMGRFVDLTRIGIVTTIVTLSSVLLLTFFTGVTGALLGLSIGEGVNCILLFLQSRTERKSSNLEGANV